MTTGHLMSYGNVVWLEIERDGAISRTEPGWTGMFKCWKAKLYARRNGIRIEKPRQVISLSEESG